MLSNTTTLTIVTPTTGNDTYLKRNIKSLQEQELPEGSEMSFKHLIVIDGKEHEEKVMKVINELEADVNVLCLPENTGYDNWICHRIYGSIGFLLNSPYVSFLDEDNFVTENHVSGLFDLISKNVSWGYTLRNVVTMDGEFVCKDLCESRGLLRPAWNTGRHFVDTNCYLFQTKVLVKISSLFYRQARRPGVEEADRVVIKMLQKLKLTNDCTNLYTVNYAVGNRADSVKKEFFIMGNKAVSE